MHSSYILPTTLSKISGIIGVLLLALHIYSTREKFVRSNEVTSEKIAVRRACATCADKLQMRLEFQPIRSELTSRVKALESPLHAASSLYCTRKLEMRLIELKQQTCFTL